MKILHVIPNLRKGGAERIVLNICNELSQKEGSEVLLITFETDNDYSFLTHNINWKVIPSDVIPSITGKPTIEVMELQKTIESFQPEIIHMHLFKATMVLSQINYSRAHYFIHFHDNMHQLAHFSVSKLFDKQMWTDNYEKKMLYKAFSNRTVSAISISKETSLYANNVLPHSIKVHELPNAIDRKRFLSEVTTTTPDRLVMIGSLVDKKNQLLAIETILELKSRRIDVSLDLIGDGTLRDELEQYAKRNGLTNCVKFHGAIDHPEKILSQDSIYIHTAKIEPFGLVILEAMASSLPVICTDGGGNRDLIVDGENGFMVNEFSAKLLADKIEYLINHPEKRMEMGRNAQKFSEQFDISKYVEELLKLYEGAVTISPRSL